jgi:hypothetical protein
MVGPSGSRVPRVGGQAAPLAAQFLPEDTKDPQGAELLMHSDGPSLNLGTHTMHPSTSLFFKLLVTMSMLHLVSRNVKPSTRVEVIVLGSPRAHAAER